MSQSILDELNKAKSDLKKGEELQNLMKEANSIIRSKKPDVKERLIALGLSESNAMKLMEPDFMKRVGFPQYRLTNNNANNRRLRERVEMLEQKWKGARSDKEEKYIFDGGEIHVNYDEDRVQIMFPNGGRVDKELYSKLRKNGYVFSRTNEAFQRKITPQAIRNAVQLFNATKIDPEQLERGIETEKEHKETLENLSEDKIDVPEAIEEIATTHIAEDPNAYSEENKEPNTPEEFDQVVLSKVELPDGWIGNEIKEREVKKQIYDQLSGPDSDKESETERLYAILKQRQPLPVFDTKKEFSNQYALNKAIESMLVKGSNAANYTAEEKAFMKKYSGYGGLDKFGTTGKGGFFEFYTPVPVIKKMWALAYKYGYNNGPVLEPSCGTGEFFQFAKPGIELVGIETSEYSSKIAQILYPHAKIIHSGFEERFIASNNWTKKDNVIPEFDLVIGNPPYGDFTGVASRYFAMGELDYVGAKNYQEYFIRRSIDLLHPGGLLVFIVGASLQSGGVLFLDSGMSRVKEYLSEKTELLDAYRLPEDVFERTKVTSEIIVIRKL